MVSITCQEGLVKRPCSPVLANQSFPVHLALGPVGGTDRVLFLGCEFEDGESDGG